MVNEKMASNLHTQLLAADQPLAAVQALGHAVVRRQQVQGLHCQWALPFSMDGQNPQLLAVTGHMGGARFVYTQTL